jgi:hypothetical protein
MCYRYVLLKSDLMAAAAQLKAILSVAFDSRYNLPPGSDVPVVRVAPGGAGREVALLHWGLVPGWAKERTAFGPKLANARAESVAEKPAFRNAFATAAACFRRAVSTSGKRAERPGCRGCFAGATGNRSSWPGCGTAGGRPTAGCSNLAPSSPPNRTSSCGPSTIACRRS